MEKIEAAVASKFSKMVQKHITFAEHSCGKYHVVIDHPVYGEASFHDTSISNMKWEVNEFFKDGSRF